MHNLYISDCTKKGVPLTQSATVMEEQDLAILCNLLINSNDKSAVINRALLTLQWHVLGRVSELDALRFDELTLYSHNKTDCVAVNMSRLKVHIQHDVHVFVHKENWKVCPIHSLASLILVTGANEFVFKSVLNNRSITHHVNELMKQLYDSWDEIDQQVYEKVCELDIYCYIILLIG